MFQNAGAPHNGQAYHHLKRKEEQDIADAHLEGFSQTQRAQASHFIYRSHWTWILRPGVEEMATGAKRALLQVSQGGPARNPATSPQEAWKNQKACVSHEVTSPMTRSVTMSRETAVR